MKFRNMTAHLLLKVYIAVGYLCLHTKVCVNHVMYKASHLRLIYLDFFQYWSWYGGRQTDLWTAVIFWISTAEWKYYGSLP